MTIPSPTVDDMLNWYLEKGGDFLLAGRFGLKGITDNTAKCSLRTGERHNCIHCWYEAAYGKGTWPRKWHQLNWQHNKKPLLRLWHGTWLVPGHIAKMWRQTRRARRRLLHLVWIGMIGLLWFSWEVLVEVSGEWLIKLFGA